MREKGNMAVGEVADFTISKFKDKGL